MSLPLARTIVALALGALGITAASAAPLSPSKAEALRERFEAHQRETRTWSADFTQTLKMPGMRAPVASEGTIFYRAPGDLRIDFSKPAGEFVLIRGDRLFIQKPGKRLAEKSMNDNAGRPFLSLIGMLRGRPTENEEQFEQEVSDEGKSYVIVLTKKEDASKRLPSRITNVVTESLNIREVLVELPNGGSLAYSFRDVSRNKPVPAAAFTLPKPR
jgi:outer membrane lipoprotein-sorting protein